MPHVCWPSFGVIKKTTGYSSFADIAFCAQCEECIAPFSGTESTEGGSFFPITLDCNFRAVIGSETLELVADIFEATSVHD